MAVKWINLVTIIEEDRFRTSAGWKRDILG